jgi:nicotinic acid mononucleotide adenylyltransferase/uridine phosphorylase
MLEPAANSLRKRREKAMRRLELRCHFLFLILASLGFVVAFGPTVMATSVGLYVGTFDPPTLAEIAMMRCALGDAGVRKECAGIGNTIARLVVSVNQSYEEDTFASTTERALMVKHALQKYGDRVEVVTAPGNREEKTRALLRDKKVERVIEFIDSASYQALKSSQASQDPRVRWQVFSLKQPGHPPLALDPKTLPANVKLFVEIEQPQGSSASAIQKAIQAGRATAGLIDPAVNAVIERLSLYQEVSQDLAKLQRSLFEESWRDSLEDIKLVCPGLLAEKDCAALAANWQTLSIVTDGKNRPDASANVLVYKRGQSADRWAEKFTNTALKPLQGSAGYAKLKPVAEDMSSKMYLGYPDAKLFHMRKVFLPKQRGSTEAVKVTQRPVACSAPPGKYNMNIAQYTSDRFPNSFANFLRAQFPTRSILPSDIYTHNQTLEEAYPFHRRDGFDTFYFLQTRRGQLHRSIYIAVRENPHAYRVVFTNLRGVDQEADVYCQISHSGTFSSMHSVHSRRELPLFVFNPAGVSLKLNDKDWLLFGFKGKWEKILLKQNWQRRPLVKQGLDIDLFTHPTIKQRLVVARNVYGDDANIIMDTFYKKGARQVIYLGTAGAIANYKVGDVVTPDEFIDITNVAVPFKKNMAHAYRAELSKQVTVHDQTKHGRVPTIYHETLALLDNWRTKSIAALDVEGFYLAKFARSHPDLKMAALFVISDQTLGESTIDESEARLDVIDDSVYKLVAFFFPKVSAPQ